MALSLAHEGHPEASAPASGRGPRPALWRHLRAALVGGIVAGAAAGAIDGIWSWRALGQFVPGAGGRLRTLAYLAGAYGLFAGLLACAGALVLVALWRGTRLGAIATALSDAHRKSRAADPASALTGLSLTLAGIPALCGSLALFYWIAWHTLATRRHIGLMLASAMGLALAAIACAALAALVLGRPVEIGLARLVNGRPRLARALSSPRAPVLAALALLALGSAAAVRATWTVLALLHLRPLWITLVIAALLPPSLAVGRRASDRLARLRPAVRRPLLLLAPVALAAVALAAGAAQGPRQAAIDHSGLGGPLGQVLRRLGDLDRDGYSRFLGGGDCDDGNAQVHPGATEIPDDDIDNNCVGGDVTLTPPRPAQFAAVPASVPPDFNVLVLTIDTVRADHFSAYGYSRPTTPNIDKVAAQGTVFLDAWAHAPSTRYSMPAILTGRYPLSVLYLPIPGQWPGLSLDNTTIAEVLASRGLTTAAITNYWYFEPLRHMNQGFRFYDNQNARLHRSIPGQGPAETRGTSSKEQSDKAIALLDRIGDQRFFLWIHYYDPHADYEPHPGTMSFGNRPMDLYDQEIRYTDHHIGRLLDELRRRGLYDKTVIVVTGDHGEGFGEHGVFMHGYHLYRAQTKVPLIMRVPGLPPRRVTTPVGHIDILPTLANLAGARPVPGTQGRSLLDLIDGRAPADADGVVFQELSYENHHEMRAAASQKCHVIYNISPNSSWEVYRVDRDPGEIHDLADDPGDCAAVEKALAAWYDQSQVPPGAAGALLPGPPHVAHPLAVDLGEAARLLAVDLPDAPVAPGQSFPVTWTFAARGPLPGGWKVFAHFEGPGGFRFQGDHEPARPPAWWRAGQFIRYTTQVTVPRGARVGRYQLWTGLFKGAERQHARSKVVSVVDDRARVGTIEVAR